LDQFVYEGFFEEILIVDEVIEQGKPGEVFQNSFVGDHGGVEFVAELVEDDAEAFETLLSDSGHREERVVEYTESVGGHKEDWKP
jgi:predicted HicB family RNase H-like nuclease